MDPDLRPFSINFDSIQTPRFIPDSPLLALHRDTSVQSLSPNDNPSQSNIYGPPTVNKQPSYGEASLTATPSPPPTFYLKDQQNISRQESKYLKQIWLLHILRLVLLSLVLAITTAIVGCTAHALQEYNTLKLDGDWLLHMWPPNIDLKPTVGLLVPASILMAMSLVVLIAAFIPLFRSHTILLNLAFALLAGVSVLLTIFAIVFNLVLVHDVDARNRESLQSFTCKLYRDSKSFMSDAEILQLPVWGEFGPPPGFKRICVESETALGLTVGLLGLAVFSSAVAGTGIWLEKKAAKRRNEDFENKWEMHS